MTTKIAVSLPDELVAEARIAVREGLADSVSAYIAEAMRQTRGRKTLGEVLDEMDAELGPPSPEAYAWADEQLRRIDQ